MNILKTKKRYPILILDEVFLSKFPKDKKNDRILLLEEDLKDKIKEESGLIDETKNLKLRKKLYLSNIISLSEKIQLENNGSDIMKMDQLQTKIYNINSQIEINEEKIINMPKEVQKANIKLLEETVKICYNIMIESENEIQRITPKVDLLREELKNAIDIKTKSQEKYNDTYNLLHDLVGGDVINFLDGKGIKEI